MICCFGKNKSEHPPKGKVRWKFVNKVIRLLRRPSNRRSRYDKIQSLMNNTTDCEIRNHPQIDDKWKEYKVNKIIEGTQLKNGQRKLHANDTQNVDDRRNVLPEVLPEVILPTCLVLANPNNKEELRKKSNDFPNSIFLQLNTRFKIYTPLVRPEKFFSAFLPSYALQVSLWTQRRIVNIKTKRFLLHHPRLPIKKSIGFKEDTSLLSDSSQYINNKSSSVTAKTPSMPTISVNTSLYRPENLFSKHLTSQALKSPHYNPSDTFYQTKVSMKFNDHPLSTKTTIKKAKCHKETNVQWKTSEIISHSSFIASLSCAVKFDFPKTLLSTHASTFPLSIYGFKSDKPSNLPTHCFSNLLPSHTSQVPFCTKDPNALTLEPVNINVLNTMPSFIQCLLSAIKYTPYNSSLPIYLLHPVHDVRVLPTDLYTRGRTLILSPYFQHVLISKFSQRVNHSFLNRLSCDSSMTCQPDRSQTIPAGNGNARSDQIQNEHKSFIIQNEILCLKDIAVECLKTEGVVSKRSFRYFVRTNMDSREDPLLSPNSLDKNKDLVQLVPIEIFMYLKKIKHDYNRRNNLILKKGWTNASIRSFLPMELVMSIERDSLASKYIKSTLHVQQKTSWYNPLFVQEPAPTPISPTKMMLSELLKHFKCGESESNLIHVESTYIKRYVSSTDISDN